MSKHSLEKGRMWTLSKDGRFAPKWVRLAPNGTHSGLFQVRFQCIWRPCAKCTEIWSEKATDLSHLGPIWPTLEPNLPTLVSSLWTRNYAYSVTRIVVDLVKLQGDHHNAQKIRALFRENKVEQLTFFL